MLEEHTNFMIKNREVLEDLKVEAKFKIVESEKANESY